MRQELLGKDIHPSLLQGLIPIDSPVFFGTDGEEKRCLTRLIPDYDLGDNFQVGKELCHDNLKLIHDVISEMKSEGLEYIWMIILEEFVTYQDNNKRVIEKRLMVRGC